MPSKNKKKNKNPKEVSSSKDDINLEELSKLTQEIEKPKISILTVSQVKRIPFLHNLSKMIEYQSDVNIHEWIITNGSNNDEDFDTFEKQISEVTCKVKIKNVSSKDLSYRNIGAFRNLANKNASGDIIICMDDDDFYFNNYVKTCYDTLLNNPQYDLVGCSSMFMYDYGFDTVFKIASFGPNHTVNCCMAYRKEYFKNHKYDETRQTGEELSYLDNYRSKMYQLPSTSAIVHMSYADNTFSGKRLNMLNSMFGSTVAPEKAPKIYHPIRTQLKDLINHDEIFESYMENFKRINNQKDTDIVFYYGNQGREWDPEDNKLYVNERKSRELGKLLIKNGYSVSVYGKFDFNEKEIDGILYYNLKYWNVRQSPKCLFIMDFFGLIPIFSEDRILKKVNTKIIIDVQSNAYIFYPHINKLLAEKIKFGFKSVFHIHMNPPDSLKGLKHKIKDIVLPTGINRELFTKDYGVTRENKRFCYTSRFNHGLLEILKFDWPVIIKNHPDAELHIYYGFENTNDDLLKEIKELLLQDGIHYHGRVSHEEIAIEFQKSSFLYYYTASPGETDCISVMEALASGCIPVIWNKNIFSRLQGLSCDKSPLEVKSHQDLAEKVSSLLTKDDERPVISEKLKNAEGILDNETVIQVYLDTIKGQYLKPNDLMQHNARPQPSNPVPENINLQNYVDSDSDSDVEYEDDSDDDNKEEAKDDFIPSEEFTGVKKGYIFKNDEKGLGYYLE